VGRGESQVNGLSEGQLKAFRDLADLKAGEVLRLMWIDSYRTGEAMVPSERAKKFKELAEQYYKEYVGETP
jgi:hypothetical protein